MVYAIEENRIYKVIFIVPKRNEEKEKEKGEKNIQRKLKNFGNKFKTWVEEM